MADLVARKLPLRHPAENLTFILMVVLNFAILARTGRRRGARSRAR
jgi:hypothetical protein